MGHSPRLSALDSSSTRPGQYHRRRRICRCLEELSPRERDVFCWPPRAWPTRTSPGEPVRGRGHGQMGIHSTLHLGLRDPGCSSCPWEKNTGCCKRWRRRSGELKAQADGLASRTWATPSSSKCGALLAGSADSLRVAARPSRSRRRPSAASRMWLGHVPEGHHVPRLDPQRCGIRGEGDGLVHAGEGEFQEACRRGVGGRRQIRDGGAPPSARNSWRSRPGRWPETSRREGGCERGVQRCWRVLGEQAAGAGLDKVPSCIRGGGARRRTAPPGAAAG